MYFMAPEEERPGKTNTGDVIRVIISWGFDKLPQNK